MLKTNGFEKKAVRAASGARKVAVSLSSRVASFRETLRRVARRLLQAVVAAAASSRLFFLCALWHSSERMTAG